MKYLLITILAFTLISCGESKSDLQKAGDMVKSYESGTELKEKLAKMKPVTEQQLKDWIPEKIGTMKLTNTRYNKNSGSFRGHYVGNGSIRYSIIDGAAFSGSVASFAAMAPNFQDEEEENYSTRKVNKKGVFAIESTEGRQKHSSKLEFIYDDRFLITVNASGRTIDELWALWDDYKLEELADWQ